MSFLSIPPYRMSLSAVVVLVTGVSCLCPPCPGTAAGGGGPAPPGHKLMLWDGDGTHQTAQGWADCDKKPTCKSVTKVVKNGGYQESGGLQFHGEGPGWIGFGWNWYGWWPENAGDDLSGHQNLTFWMRVEAESEDQAPVVDSMNVALRCSNGKKNSAGVSLSKYARTVLDGKWHKVEVPLKEFYKGKEGKEFDKASAWEFNFSIWSATPRNFNVYFDDLAVENPPAEGKPAADATKK